MGKPATLTPEEIWHLVYYVRSLPYETSSARTRSEAESTRRETSIPYSGGLAPAARLGP